MFEEHGLVYNPHPEVVPNTMRALRVTELARERGLHARRARPADGRLLGGSAGTSATRKSCKTLAVEAGLDRRGRRRGPRPSDEYADRRARLDRGGALARHHRHPGLRARQPVCSSSARSRARSSSGPTLSSPSDGPHRADAPHAGARRRALAPRRTRRSRIMSATWPGSASSMRGARASGGSASGRRVERP